MVYRIGSIHYPANDGKGAHLYGGRWNHKGTSVIYAAESRALAALEVLANAGELADEYAVTTIEWPDEMTVTVIEPDQLPSGWDVHEPIAATRDIGPNWATSLVTAVLVVPSALIPGSETTF